MFEKRMLFSPGPVMTSDRVKSSLIHPDMCHRHAMFECLVDGIRAKLLTLLDADVRYGVIIISGSGTAANETALSSIVADSDHVLLVKNGEFGERLEEILLCYRYTIEVLAYPWGTVPDIAAIDAALAKNNKIRWICMTCHETSTGMRNPVHEVGTLVARYGRRFLVDCISALGAENVSMLRDHIDICTGVPNKAIGGLPGVSFVVAKRESIPTLGREVPRRNVYLNLQRHLSMADEHSQTPNTPSVTMFVALDAALQEWMDEGVEARIDRYRKCAQIIRDGVRALGLRMLLPDELCGNTVTSVFLPEGCRLDEFIEALDRQGYVVYPGKRGLYEQNVFQIANMGNLRQQDCEVFLGVLEEVLVSLGLEKCGMRRNTQDETKRDMK